MKYPDKILTTTEFVKWVTEKPIPLDKRNLTNCIYSIMYYADIMSKPLELKMFVSEDENDILFKGWECKPERESEEYGIYLLVKSVYPFVYKDGILYDYSSMEGIDNIEELLQRVDLIGTDNFWKNILK